jgi:hypothetical protein
MDRLLTRDERELSVDRAADRLAYIVLSFGLLAIVAYRSFFDGVASWDLLALVLVGGAVSAIYRFWRGVLTRQAAIVIAATAVIALVVAAAIVLGAAR